MAYSQYNTEVTADAPIIRHTFENDYSNSGSLAVTTTSSGNNVRGSTHAAAGSTSGGSFDGTAWIQDANTSNYFGDRAWTVEAWVKTTSAGGDYKTIMRRSTSSSHLLIRVRGGAITDAGKLDIYYGIPGGGTTTFYSTSRVDDGNWHHVAIVAHGANAPLQIYIDGVLDASSPSNIPAGGTHTNTDPLQIGREASGTETFYGQIDEFAIYDTNLSATRIQAHYDAAQAAAPVVADISVASATLSLASVEITAVDAQKFISYDATTPTVTVKANDEVLVVRDNEIVDADNFQNISLQANDVTVQTITVSTYNASADWQTDGTNVSKTGSTSADSDLEIQGNQKAVMLFNKPAAMTIADSVIANLYLSYADPATLSIRGITSPVSANSASVPVSGNEVRVDVSGSGQQNIDITSLMSEPFYGIVIEQFSPGTSTVIFQATEAPSGAETTPSITYRYEVTVIDSAVDLDTPTVSLAGIVATAADSTGITWTATTPTISVAAPEGVYTATVDPNVDLTLDTAISTLNAYEADPVVPVTVDVDSPVTSDFYAYDVEVEVTQGVIAELDTPSIQVTHYQVTDVNGEPVLPTETEDPYFISTMQTFLDAYQFGISGSTTGAAQGGPIDPNSAFWYRFNERSGTNFYDRQDAGADANPLINHGVTIGLNEGPSGRHNIEFNGGAWIEQPQSITGDETSVPPTSLEFTFRTEKATQFIMGGADMSWGLNQNPLAPWELWTVDGVLELRQYEHPVNYREGMAVPYSTTRMRTNVADGQWHHIVIQRAHGGTDERASATDRFFQFEAYLDGRLELRRRLGTIAAGFPDFIGGKPNQYYRNGQWTTVGSSLAGDQWFDGEMTELVFRLGNVIVEDEITLQRDNVMAIDAYRPSAARMSLDAGKEVTAKGNKVRLLILDFGSFGTNAHPYYDRASTPFSIPNQAQVTAEKIPNNISPIKGELQYDFPGYGEPNVPFYPSTPSDSNNLTQWFRHHVFKDSSGQHYRDEITDNYRLIDLDSDINMDDYDLISIVGYPRNDAMWATYQSIDDRNLPGAPSMKQELERVLGQVREQVVNNRKSLYITDPFSAIELGIIDKAVPVPKFEEWFSSDQRLGANIGGLDWHAMLTDPFNTAFGKGHPVPEWTGVDDKHDVTKRSLWEKAATYEDRHANLKQRVVNEVEGLTTLPGWIKEDEIIWWNINPMANPPYHFSRKYTDRSAGLEIGDEFYMIGAEIKDDGFSKSLWEANWMEREHGWIAAPIANIKVGKAVTAFQRFIYATNMEADDAIASPYGDYAVSIAVEPGDMWDGERVSGKVYVNFTEAHVHNPEHGEAGYIMMNSTRYPDARPEDVLFVGKTINTGINNQTFRVTPEMMSYNWSTHYMSIQGSEVPLPGGGKDSDWGWSSGGVRQSGGFSTFGAGEAMQWKLKPIVGMERIDTPPMAHRAIKWLTSDLDVSGNANVAVDTAKVNTEAPEATVETVQNADVTLGTASFIVEAHNDSDTVSPDVTVLVGTPAFTVQVVGLAEEILLDTPTVTIDVVPEDLAEVEIDWSETLVFTLPRQGLTLIMEET